MAYVVVYETRNPIGAIVEEIDSIFLDEALAVMRRKNINDDPADHGMVADVREYPIRDFALTATPEPYDYRAPRARLTPKDVLQIRQRKAVGESLTELADAFDVSPQTISDICLRRTWRHV